jgi:hypothetical protein
MINGHPFAAVPATVLTGVPVSLEDVFLVEREGLDGGSPDIPLKTDDAGDDPGHRGGPDQVCRILDPLCPAGEEQDNGSAHIANLKWFKRSVQDQNFMWLHTWPFEWPSRFHPWYHSRYSLSR